MMTDSKLVRVAVAALVLRSRSSRVAEVEMRPRTLAHALSAWSR